MDLFNTQLLDRAVAGVQDKVGQFLSAKKVLIDLGDRISAVARNAAAASRQEAQGLQRRQQTLLSRQKALEATSSTTLQDASTFKDQVDKLQTQLKGANLSVLGSRSLQVIRKNATTALNLSKRAAALVKDINNHLDEVDGLKKDTFKLEGHPDQAMSFTDKLSSAVGTTKFFVVGGGVILALIYLGPPIRALLTPRRRKAA